VPGTVGPQSTTGALEARSSLSFFSLIAISSLALVPVADKSSWICQFRKFVSYNLHSILPILPVSGIRGFMVHKPALMCNTGLVFALCCAGSSVVRKGMYDGDVGNGGTVLHCWGLRGRRGLRRYGYCGCFICITSCGDCRRRCFCDDCFVAEPPLPPGARSCSYCMLY
jgi:hypothetical protein